MGPGRSCWMGRPRWPACLRRSFSPLPAYFLCLASARVPLADAESTSTGTVHRFTIDSAAHDRYGLSYPATFVFEVPPGPPTLRAYKLPEWTAIPTRDPSEVYSGVEAARFDMDAGRALVSAAFPADSDTLMLGFVDERFGTLVSATYDSMARYYDDSQAVVVLTADDWQEHDQWAFAAACDACQARKLWFTAGICTAGMAGPPGGGPPDWSLIQQEIDQGFVEPASHSRHHLYPPYNLMQWGVQSSYEEEIIGSRDDILGHLHLPPLNRRGAAEYLYTWIEPFGVIDHTARLMVGANGYLADRQSVYSRWFASWHETYGLYPVAGTAWIDTLTVPGPMNALFDWILYEGSIYIMMCHPRVIDWQAGPVLEHLDYLAHRPEVWYVGLGHLYAYHVLQDRNLLAHEALTTTGADAGAPDLPPVLALWNPVPNPAVARAEIPFELAAAGDVRLAVYDVSGRMVRGLLAGPRSRGLQTAIWDARDERGRSVPAGVYFIRLESGGEVRIRRLTCAR